MAVRDISEAYQTIPLHRLQWPATVVNVGVDLFCVDPFAAFGARPSGRVFGTVADTLADLLCWRGMGPVTKWVDDFVFFRVRREFLGDFNRTRGDWSRLVGTVGGMRQARGRIWYEGGCWPGGEVVELFEDCQFSLRDCSVGVAGLDGDYAYGLQDVDDFSSLLGVPWETSKDQPFASGGEYIGLHWDLQDKSVSLSSAKKGKYMDAIAEWQRKTTYSLLEVQQLYGKLLHATLVVPAGRARLTGLETMLGLYSNRPFALRHPPSSVRQDLEWWLSILCRTSVYQSISSMFPTRLTDYGAFSDASSGVGIAIVIGDQWRAWRLLPGWKSRDGEKDIQWAEAVGFELLILALTGGSAAGTNFRVFGDNHGVVEGWRNFRSRNTAVNNVFKRILNHLKGYGSVECVYPSYVRSGNNPADAPSRAQYPNQSRLLPLVPIPSQLQHFIIDATEPLTPSERQLWQEGRAPLPSPKPPCESEFADQGEVGGDEYEYLQRFGGTW
ncbi:hypothetical protein EST38_g10612 [Candolleomyces aberdarensis]|uniref:Reverse transcriptase n=1 Tax=Candolleomyces aberdarensis TaxID=2316362 RepID=A0A4Q2D6X0_9AGAR|nr:hypothetical protein EST38_g10612 [Candolleomyces aberdarensis]